MPTLKVKLLPADPQKKFTISNIQVFSLGREIKNYPTVTEDFEDPTLNDYVTAIVIENKITLYNLLLLPDFDFYDHYENGNKRYLRVILRYERSKDIADKFYSTLTIQEDNVIFTKSEVHKKIKKLKDEIYSLDKEISTLVRSK